MRLDLSKQFDVTKAIIFFEKLKIKQAKIEIKEFSPRRSFSQTTTFMYVSQFWLTRQASL